MVKNTDNYNQIIKKLLKDFEASEIDGADCFRKIRKIAIAASAKDQDDAKYDKIIDEVDVVFKSLDQTYKKECKKIKDLL